MVDCMIVRRGDVCNVPEFSYSGEYQLVVDDRDNWRLKLLTSGTLVFNRLISDVDVFLVGGGGAGGYGWGGGGGGGYTTTEKGISLRNGIAIDVVVGSGGEPAPSASTVLPTSGGGETSVTLQEFVGNAINMRQLTANGGGRGHNNNESGNGGNGGNGGAAGNNTVAAAGGAMTGAGGGAASGRSGGTGQGSNTYEFGELRTELSEGHVLLHDHYAAGGGGGNGVAAFTFGGGRGISEGSGGNANTASLPARANTGDGGGGGGTSKVGNHGGSGIVIFRNAR